MAKATIGFPGDVVEQQTARARVTVTIPGDATLVDVPRGRFNVIPAKGDKPVKGVDYWTAEDVAQMREEAAAEAVKAICPVAEAGPAAAVRVDDALAGSAVRTVVAIAPGQDLHGYDNPWPAGGGKNKLNFDGIKTVAVRNGSATWGNNTVTLTATSNDCYLQYGASVWGEDVRIPVSEGDVVRFTWTANNALGNAGIFPDGTSYDFALVQSDAGIASLTVKPGYSFVTIRVGVTLSGDSTTFSNLMVTVNNADTTFSPYSNICPITGWTGATVTRCGRNLLDVSAAEIGTAWNGASNPARARLVIPLKQNTQYTLTMNGTNALDGVFSSLSTVVPPPGIDARTFPYSFDSGVNDYLVLGFNKTAISQADIDALNLQLEPGSTATAYEPYQGSTLSIAFPSGAGTVYGGTLDVNEDGSGVLVVDRGLFTVTTAKIDAAPNTGYHAATGSAWVRNLNYNEGVRRVRYGNDNPLGQCPCNFAEKVVLNNNDISSSQYRTSFKGPWTTFAEFREAVAALEAAGVTPCYAARLNTPATYALTAGQVALLRGNNALWADCGDVTLTYRQDIALVLEALQEART